jgi:hypothetical protein
MHSYKTELPGYALCVRRIKGATDRQPSIATVLLECYLMWEEIRFLVGMDRTNEDMSGPVEAS